MMTQIESYTDTQQSFFKKYLSQWLKKVHLAKSSFWSTSEDWMKAKHPYFQKKYVQQNLGRPWIWHLTGILWAPHIIAEPKYMLLLEFAFKRDTIERQSKVHSSPNARRCNHLSTLLQILNTLIYQNRIDVLRIIDNIIMDKIKAPQGLYVP